MSLRFTQGDKTTFRGAFSTVPKRVATTLGFTGCGKMRLSQNSPAGRKEIAQDVSPGYAVAENAKSPGDLSCAVNSTQDLTSWAISFRPAGLFCDQRIFRTCRAQSFWNFFGMTLVVP